MDSSVDLSKPKVVSSPILALMPTRMSVYRCNLMLADVDGIHNFDCLCHIFRLSERSGFDPKVGKVVAQMIGAAEYID